MNQPWIRVVLVDDQYLLRTGISFILAAEPVFVVVAEAADGALGFDAAVTERPGVVLMDVRMPVEDGIAATRRIRQVDCPPVLISPRSTTTSCGERSRLTQPDSP
jgi:DNA-binding NarL/FixJ family response regulator